jgi:uncharacterized coiled-coil protein SlyX
MRYEPNTSGNGPNIIGGNSLNSIGAGLYGVTIGGGGRNAEPNTVLAIHGTIAGGYANTIQTSAERSTIGGGQKNTNGVNAGATVIAGGAWNYIGEDAHESVISGGTTNNIQKGGYHSTIAGGTLNTIDTNAYRSTISGGYNNFIQTNAYESVISGGLSHEIQSGAHNSVIGGGRSNTVGTNSYGSVISGGYWNIISAEAQYATISGGRSNIAGGNYSFAAGLHANANHNQSYVWSDGSAATSSSVDKQITMRGSGGFRFFTGTGTAGAQLAAGATSWTTLSDRNEKKNFAPVDGQEVLEKLSRVPVQRWNYKWEGDAEVPHLGPIAQEFKAAFFPGRDDKGITTLEFDGVELAAIQGLNQKVEAQKAELKAKQEKIESLEQRLADLEKLVRGALNKQ